MKKIVLLIIFFLSPSVYATDSSLVDTSYIHIRKRAAILSTLIPGVGQFYNETGHRKVQGRKNISWWRAPLFWVGLGATGYFSVFNGKEAFQLKNEWLYRKNNNGIGLYVKYSDISNSNDLLYGNENQTFGFLKHAKWRDYNIAGFILIYGLNVLDAYVDAHFVTFDVSQNLTLSFQPKIYTLKNYGVELRFNFN